MASGGLVDRGLARRVLLSSAVTILLVVAASAVLGHLSIGLAAALGILIGLGNSLLAQRFFSDSLPFGLVSFGRLIAATLLLLLLGLIFGFGDLPAVILGVALSQLLPSAAALVHLPG